MSPLSRGRRWASLLLTATAAGLFAASSAIAEDAPYLSLNEALTRAAVADPGMGAASARLTAAEAVVRQAGVRPPPSLDLEVENFAGTGVYSLLDRAEATLSYQRPIERGGKRAARLGQARSELEVMRLKGQARRLDVLRDTQLAYVEAQGAEADLLVAEARLISARASQADVDRRVKNARDPVFAGSRAEVLTAQAEIARDRAKETARTAKAALAAHWGEEPDFSLKLDEFFQAAAPAGSPSGSGAPELHIAEAEAAVAAAAVRVEQARSVADPTVRAGVRYFGEGSDAALVVGGSLPLGAGAANRANVERAIAERSAAEQEVAAVRLVRKRQIAQLVARMRILAAESERIRAEVIPHALRTVDQVTAGFNRGGFQFLDVTEAERALADARQRRVEVLRDFHKAQAELDRLTGRHLVLVSTPAEERR